MHEHSWKVGVAPHLAAQDSLTISLGTEYLAESDYLEDLDHIVRCFDKTTKVRFNSDKQAQYIKFGSTRDNDPNCNIRFGQLKLDGKDVAPFFEGSISCIVNATKEQVKMAHKPISVS